MSRSPNGVFISPEKESELLRLYDKGNGATLSYLERYFHKDRATVRHHLIRLGAWKNLRGGKSRHKREHATTRSFKPPKLPDLPINHPIPSTPEAEPPKYASILYDRKPTGRSYEELREEAREKNLKKFGKDYSYMDRGRGFWDEKTFKALNRRLSKAERRKRQKDFVNGAYAMRTDPF